MGVTLEDSLEGRLGGGGASPREGETDDGQRRHRGRGKWRSWPGGDCLTTRLTALAVAAVALLPSPATSLIPEFLSYKTCVDSPPAFSGCMSNVTADFGERVVLNCQVRRTGAGGEGDICTLGSKHFVFWQQ